MVVLQTYNNRTYLRNRNFFFAKPNFKIGSLRLFSTETTTRYREILKFWAMYSYFIKQLKRSKHIYSSQGFWREIISERILAELEQVFWLLIKDTTKTLQRTAQLLCKTLAGSTLFSSARFREFFTVSSAGEPVKISKCTPRVFNRD